MSDLVARLEASPVVTGGGPKVESGSLSAVAAGEVDAATLLKGYAEQGPSGLLAAGGDYSVVVADPDRSALALARRGAADGLFWTAGDDGVSVAATPAGLGIPLQPDPDALRRYVDTGAADSPLTGIDQVRPDEAVLLTRAGAERVAAPQKSAVQTASDQQTAELTDVARLADALTADLWQFLTSQGVPAATPAGYVEWAAAARRTGRVDDAPPLVPTRDLLMRLKNRIYGSFLSDTFAARPWVDANAEIKAFEEFIASNGDHGGADRFWRLYLSEQWARIVPENEPAPVETPEKGPFDPNEDKQLEITVDGEQWSRYPIRTELFAKGDDLAEAITGYVAGLAQAAADAGRDVFGRRWYLVVSEKIVAIAQGRSYFIWEIKPNWWARTLSRYVVRTPYGIGLGSPWTMQLALQEVGLLRILFASAVSVVGKALGKRGWFYRVAGPAVRAIDGPTEYSAYPANVSAKLAPANPAKVSAELAEALRSGLPAPARDTLRGVVVIDANDIGRNVMGQASDRPDRFFEAVFADNPLGQGNERTPLCVVVGT